MTTVRVFAPAKVNLTLHVTGKRDDGYHLIDSLVAFAPVGDMLSIMPSDAMWLKVDGPEAEGVPEGLDNFALRAGILAAASERVSIKLTKHLPAASGVGGGSSDAAAAYRAVHAYRDLPQPTLESVGETYRRCLLALGADVPMCLTPRPQRAQGIGEQLEFVALPPLPAVLVNPRVPVSTPDVFRELTYQDNSPMPDLLPDFHTPSDLIGWLAEQRNDLEAPAIRIAPVIAEVLSAISASDGCNLARMSGSGATCFGLYKTAEACNAAERDVRAQYPDWWIASGRLGDQSERAAPMVS